MGLTWEISIARHLSPSKRLKFWTKIPWYVLNSKVLCKSTILRVFYTDFAWFLHVLVVWIPDSFPEIVLKIRWNHLKSYQIPDMLVESSIFFSSILGFFPVPWHVFSGRWHRERLRHHLHRHSALGIASETQVDDPAMVFHRDFMGITKVIFHGNIMIILTILLVVYLPEGNNIVGNIMECNVSLSWNVTLI